MKILCVDDEKIILDNIVSKCKSIDYITEVYGFLNGNDVINFICTKDVDVVLMDIDMPDINGLELAKRIKELKPYIEIIFLTGYSQYAVEAFKTRASGYLLKPFTVQEITDELNVIKTKKDHNSNTAVSAAYLNETKGVFAKTFGNFDLYLNGKPVSFSWKKSKEVLAYLIDRHGSTVNRRELAAILFEDSNYSRSNQTYITKIINALYYDLNLVGIEKIFVKGKDAYSVNEDLINCDSWNFLAEVPGYEQRYQGEYMLQYSWGEESIGIFERRLKKI